MPYPFCCPQGHVLQAELLAIGQLQQCPVCGAGFLVPPPDFGGARSPTGWQGPGVWPPPNAPSGLPVAVAVDMPSMPGGSPAMAPLPSEGFPPSPFPQQPSAPAADAALLARASAAVQAKTQSAATADATDDKPAIDLGFDPNAKAALPFDLPGQSGAAEEETPTAPQVFPAAPAAASAFLAGPPEVTPLPASPFPPPSSPANAFPTAPLSGATLPSASLENMATGDDLPTDAPAARQAPAPPPKILHIRCPSGHVVKAPSDLLGKNGRCPACKKTFELRYENSIEFQRRTEKILRREQNEADRTWLGWVFVAAFLIFVALVGAVILIGR